MICANKDITVFHYNKDSMTKEHIGKVSVFSDIKASVSGADNASSSEIIIRIPTQ